MTPPYTNSYDRTTHCYWFYSKVFSKSEMIYLNYPIKLEIK